MTFKKKNFLLCLLLLCAAQLSAQKPSLCPPSESKKAVKYFEEAKSVWKSKRDLKEVKELVEKAAEEDTAYAEPWLLLGDASWVKKDYPTMKKAYARLIALCPDADANAHYRLGTYLFDTKKYAESKPYLKSFLDFNSDNESKNKEVELLLFRVKLITNPVPFKPEIVKAISTADPEYLAIISPDNDYCYFTRRFEMISKGSLTPLSVEKFMMSKRMPTGEFDKGDPLPLPFNLNNTNNEGSPSISKDNRFLFFTRNENGNFDLFYSEYAKGKWGDIVNLGPNVNDPKQWDSQPSISPDGKTLYFCSFRDSVNGTADIFKTVKTNGSWSKPVPLSFNTNGNEKSPFIHPDNKTLYFSSDSLPGMGGFDIFMCKKDASGNWGPPINLGYPINTEGDEVGFFVSTDGSKGYFASDKIGTGGYDIYSFDMPSDKRPEKVLFVKGQVKGDNEQVPLAAKIEIRNVNTSETVQVDYDSTTGNYASVVLFDADYIMTVKKEGFAYNSQYFSQNDTTIKAVVSRDLDVKKMVVGEAYTLNDILFETNSAELETGSKIIIKDFAAFLRENPKVTVSIHGHTDSEGDPQSNLLLSETRAKSVYTYLVTLGIAPSRLSSKGFGSTKPVAPNNTSEGRSKNRRTEFVITNK